MIPEKVLNAGGYAHPVGPDVCGGLTVRDVFAAHALGGILASYAVPDVSMPTDGKAAKWAYQLADAMLAARAPQPQAT